MHGEMDTYGDANSQRDLLGWADQLGYTPGQRRLIITKNSGTVGYTGLRRTEPDGTWTTSGWCAGHQACMMLTGSSSLQDGYICTGRSPPG